MFCRYLLDYGVLHPTEKYYPLRPEFAESTFYLYQATKGGPNRPRMDIYTFHLHVFGGVSCPHGLIIYTVDSSF
jgi:hypothetical protein